MTSLYLAALAGVLMSRFTAFIRSQHGRESPTAPERRRLRPQARFVEALVGAMIAFALVALVRLEVGGYVAPSLAALAFAVGERVPLRPWRQGRRVAPLRSATLSGIYTGLFWPLGLTWSALSLLLRLAGGRDRRLLRWIPLAEAGSAIAGGYLWRLPDAFLVVAFLLGAQQIAQTLQHFMPTRWLGRPGRGIATPRLTRIGVVGVTLIGIAVYFLNLYVYHGFGEAADLFRKGSGDFRAVALTFDDGPNPRFTPEILDVLRRYDVPATFFLVGRAAERHPDLTRRIVREGHELGSHTYSHRNLLGARPATVRQEILRGNRAIEAVTGIHPRYFRPPRGAYSALTLEVARAEGQVTVLYSLSSRDWLELSPRDIARSVLGRVGPGDILLLHDSGDLIRNRFGDRSNTLRALPLIIEGLKERGYEFLTVSQLLFITRLEEAGDEARGERNDGDARPRVETRARVMEPLR